METSTTTTSDEAQNSGENSSVGPRNWVKFTDETEKGSSSSEAVKSESVPPPETSPADSPVNKSPAAVIEPSVEIVPSTPTRPSNNSSSSSSLKNNTANNNSSVQNSTSNHNIRETQLSSGAHLHNVDLRNAAGASASNSVPTTGRRNNTGFSMSIYYFLKCFIKIATSYSCD